VSSGSRLYKMPYDILCIPACDSYISNLKAVRPKSCFLSIFPVFSWLRSYSLKNDFINDLISGCTVAVMHIPQGMGYAILGNVPPITGIYMAFFPVILYFFLGTSRHNSMGEARNKMIVALIVI
jgi:solute carrier family 26, other